MRAVDNPATYYTLVEVGEIKDMHMLAFMDTTTQIHPLRVSSPFFLSCCALKPRGQVWFTRHSRSVSRTIQRHELYLRSCPLSSEATSSMWTWSHSWENGGKKKSGYIRRSISEWSAVQAGLFKGEPPGATAATGIKRALNKDKEGGNKVSGHRAVRRRRCGTQSARSDGLSVTLFLSNAENLFLYWR